jgi:hypothetical protein
VKLGSCLRFNYCWFLEKPNSPSLGHRNPFTAVAVDGHTGQSGAAPNKTLFIVRCVPRQSTVGVWSGWLLKSFVLLWHRTVRCVLTLQFWLLWPLFTVQRSRPLDAVDRCYVGSPDSSVNYSGVTPRKTRERPVREVPRPGHRTASGAPLAAPILVFCSKLCRVSQLIFFVGLCWTLCTWDKWQLGKLVSPRGLWWTSNIKIDYRKCLSSFSFQSPLFWWLIPTQTKANIKLVCNFDKCA